LKFGKKLFPPNFCCALPPIDIVDKVVECKHLDCPPVNINFRRTSNHFLVMEKPSAQTKGNFAETLKRVIKDIFWFRIQKMSF